MKDMLERYPEGKLPIDETRPLFRDAPQATLKELGIDEEKLRSYAFGALRTVEERLLKSGPVSAEEKAALVQEAATEWLDTAIRNFSQAGPFRASLAETRRLFQHVPQEQLDEAGITLGNLRRIAWYARRSAEYQHEQHTPVAVDSVEVLTDRFARNVLSDKIQRNKALNAVSPQALSNPDEGPDASAGVR